MQKRHSTPSEEGERHQRRPWRSQGTIRWARQYAAFGYPQLIRLAQKMLSAARRAEQAAGIREDSQSHEPFRVSSLTMVEILVDSLEEYEQTYTLALRR